MAKGKSQFATWYCATCNRGNYITAYNKRNNENIVKVLSKHCGQCHIHTDHKRKDTKKAAK
jgi:ribosomal protein L33